MEVYSVGRLEGIKNQHESLRGTSQFRIDESVLHKVAHEMDSYWMRLDEAKKKHVAPDLAIPLPQHASYTELLEEASATISNFFTMAQWCRGPFEVKELGIPNNASRLNALILLMAAKYFEAHLSLNLDDGPAHVRLDVVKQELLMIAKNGWLVD